MLRVVLCGRVFAGPLVGLALRVAPLVGSGFGVPRVGPLFRGGARVGADFGGPLVCAFAVDAMVLNSTKIIATDSTTPLGDFPGRHCFTLLVRGHCGGFSF